MIIKEAIDDLISRQAAIDGLKKTILFRFRPDLAAHVKNYLESFPAAEQWHEFRQEQPKRNKGHWIVHKENGEICGECSCCGIIQYAGFINFCYECGADMREVKNE